MVLRQLKGTQEIQNQYFISKVCFTIKCKYYESIKYKIKTNS